MVFSGQGAQHSSMLSWLDPAQPAVQAVARVLGEGWRLSLGDPGWSSLNANAQPLLAGLCVAAWEELAPALPRPTLLAGYSVGELAAWAAAGVVDADSVVPLAQLRARAMDRAAEKSGSTVLMGVSEISEESVRALCVRFGLEVSIRTGLFAFVVGGPVSQMTLARADAGRNGANCMLLPVGLASHTQWMKCAAIEFAQGLKEVPFKTPQVALLSAESGARLMNAESARHALAYQVDHQLHWTDCMIAIASRKPSCFLEIGPGRGLCKLWENWCVDEGLSIDAPARSADEFRSAAAIVSWVKRSMGV